MKKSMILIKLLGMMVMLWVQMKTKMNAKIQLIAKINVW